MKKTICTERIFLLLETGILFCIVGLPWYLYRLSRKKAGVFNILPFLIGLVLIAFVTIFTDGRLGLTKKYC